MADHDFDFGGGRPPYARRRHSPSRPSRRVSDFAAVPQIVDPDTCRICRGESTPDEPLFYPCKCSGSIKYVHQNCLLEWLSHSQKKHCELCKTPFRFTKLYSPKMPSNLPVHVFITHMTKYILSNLVVWLRALLVGCVWLCWLPYLMRRMWSLLFWLSDEGLGSLLLAKTAGSSSVTNATLDAIESANATSSLFDNATSIQDAASAIVTSALNGSATDPTSDIAVEPTRLFLFLLKAIFPSVARRDNSMPAASENGLPIDLTQGSLLSNVSFLRNLTRQPAINRFIIMVLEGQIITVLVIVCFILIILVRDYVVQQQPEINMRAAFAGQEVARLDEPVPELIPPPPELAPLPAAPEAAHQQNEPAAPDAPPGDDEEPAPRLFRPENERPIAAFRRRTPHHLDAQPGAQPQLRGSPHETQLRDGRRSPSEAGATTSGVFNPQHPAGPPNPEAGPTAAEHYLRVYREANGDPEVIMRLLREESVRNRTQARTPEIVNGYQHPETSNNSGSSSIAAATSSRQGSGEHVTTPGAYGDRSGMDDVFGPAMSRSSDEMEGRDSMSSRARSKQPAWPEQQEEFLQVDGAAGEHDDEDLAAYSRRRAVSDGPQPREYTNPLANNSWSFSPIPTEPSSPVEGGEVNGGSSSPFIFTANDIPVSPDRHEFSGTFGGSDREDAFEDDEDGEAARSDVFHDRTEERDQGAAQEINAEAAPAGPAPPAPNGAPEAHAQNPRGQQAALARVADFFWGGIEPPTEDELRAAEAEDEDLDDDDAAEDIGADNGEPGEAGEAGAQALDQDALDDIEDFEGIMELIGMRGPIAGLFQNAVFCACLVFVAIFVCIFLPYNLGRTAICIAANPMRLVRMLFSAAKFIQDLTAVIAGALSWATLSALSVLSRVTGQNARMDSVGSSITYTWELTANASSRLSSGFFDDFPFHASEIQNFSAVSHGALLELKAHVVGVAMTLWNTAAFTVESPVSEVASTVLSNGTYLAGLAKNMTVTAATSILTPGSWIIDLNTAAPVQIDPALASWSGSDRFWAILAGYLSFASLATLYVTRGAPLSSGQLGQDWEASLVDLINQASGVTKVILIIGIEMLVFPLYCGLLMDAALLPLFEHATIRSRYDFSVNYPLTSIFVHWFVGTGYMFHFALFVSMCRKIMRNGVLYFIRDPDDPEFHPVRDVLERNFFTQLRKIMFSALVYGGLVVVCLGGVVWSLSFASTVLPIHYSSNEPVLEFPVDLLFYNFLMPLAVRVLRPSDALHAMYTWWFKQCARMLRLTWFLFGQRQVDEEGKLLLPKNSPYKSLPWYRKQFLRLDGDNNVVPKTWNDLMNDLLNPDPSSSSTVGSLTKTKRKLVRDGQLRRDGRFVRTPASDQVRIPKGRRVFLEVNEITQVPLSTAPHLEQYFTDQYQLVYLPPNFRFRIFLFIFLIWMFAAVTGVSLTILPLIVGRRLFQCLLPGHVRTNDIYAFSIGIYVLGTIGYSVLRAQALSTKIRAWATAGLGAMYEPGAPKQVATVILHGVQLVYTYLNVFVFFPLLASALIELYLIIPLHTYMSPPKAPVLTGGADAVPDVGAALAAANSIHTIRAVQAWTLGLLYLKLATRVLRSSFAGTRLANASQAVFRRGWLRPDVKVLTRAFVMPAIALCVIAVAAPPVVIVPLIKRVLVAAGAFDRLSDDPVSMALIYRLSFLSAALVALSSTMVWSLVGVFRGWKSRIRDEAYLIGERLHNFGVGTAVTTRA